jgi:hypothetical protein
MIFASGWVTGTAGHNRPSDDTDDQTAIAFRACKPVVVVVKIAAAQHARIDFPDRTTAFGPTATGASQPTDRAS